MKQSTLQLKSLNPMVIFWLGVLTGALVVGLTFLYRSFDAKDGSAALFRSTSYSAPSYAAPTYDSLAMPTPPSY